MHWGQRQRDGLHKVLTSMSPRQRGLQGSCREAAEAGKVEAAQPVRLQAATSHTRAGPAASATAGTLIAGRLEFNAALITGR